MFLYAKATFPFLSWVYILTPSADASAALTENVYNLQIEATVSVW